MSRSRIARSVAALALAPLLVACENSATAYVVDTSQHALILVRERPYFWSSTINQAIVVSRLPYCQSRVSIHPGTIELTEMAVYEAGALLWALRQGERWYLASTETCQVQDWNNPTGAAPGAHVGNFRLKDGRPVFAPAQS